MRVGDVTRPDERSPSVASLVRAVTAGGCPGRPVLGGLGRVIRFSAIPRRPLAFESKYEECCSRDDLSDDTDSRIMSRGPKPAREADFTERRLAGWFAPEPAGLNKHKNGLAGVDARGKFLIASDSRGQGGMMLNPHNPASSWDGANLSNDEPFPGRCARRPISLAALLQKRGE